MLTALLTVFFVKGANLQGVKMLCTNAEGASLKGCNFEDPSGLKANLEGDAAANMLMLIFDVFSINLQWRKIEKKIMRSVQTFDC